jgi:hypothetical protein
MTDESKERSGLLLLLDGGFCARSRFVSRLCNASRRETCGVMLVLINIGRDRHHSRILYRNVWIHFKISICCCAFSSSSIIGISSENFIFYALVCYIAPPRFHKFQFFIRRVCGRHCCCVWYVCCPHRCCAYNREQACLFFSVFLRLNRSLMAPGSINSRSCCPCFCLSAD